MIGVFSFESSGSTLSNRMISMEFQDLKRLTEERAAVIEKTQAIAKKAHEEKRGLTADERKEMDAMLEDAANKRGDIERLQKMRAEVLASESFKNEAERAEHEAKRKAGDPDNVITAQDRDLALRAVMMSQNPRWRDESIPDSYRNAAKKCGAENIMFRNTFAIKLPSWSEAKRRAAEGVQYRATTAQTITTTGGGHLFTSRMGDFIVEQLVAFGGVREAAQVIQTSGGENLLYPKIDDTGNESDRLAINTAETVSSLVFGQTTIGSEMLSTGMVKVPLQLFQDSAFDVAELVGRMLGIRAARGQNTVFSTSTLGQGITGVVTHTPATVTSTGQTGSITYAKLVALYHAIDPDYRRNPTCRWMMNDGVLKEITQIVDSQGNPIFRPSNAIGTPDMIFNRPVVINQTMATATGAAAKCILWGDFNTFLIRDVVGTGGAGQAPGVVIQLNERYADLLQTAYFMAHRHGSNVLWASTTNAKKPIQALKTST